MPVRVVFLAALLPALAAPAQAGVALQLGDARIVLDGRGRVISLRARDGREYAPAGAPPAFEVATSAGTLRPTEVRRAGDALLVRLGERGRMRLALTEGRGFVLLRLTDLSGVSRVERIRLFCLPVKGLGSPIAPLNACWDGRFATAAMATSVNVSAGGRAEAAAGADHQGCTHRFEPVTTSPPQGQRAARFSAASRRQDAQGWSVVGRDFEAPLDLRGCRAIRAWVHGDGGGQLLKIQLYDGEGGYRDDYVKVDFRGWRRVFLDQPQFNTLRYDRVRRLSFYYNALPPQRRVECLIDHVEALVGEGPDARAVLLEDFEDPGSPLWPIAGAQLYAETLRRFGLRPAGVGIIACPRARFEETIARFERAAGLPSPRPGGVWSKRSPLTKRSYLFITAFTEADTDLVLDFARRGGFGAILIDQGSWCASTGHYGINTRAFPRGLAGLRDTVRRMQRAGFRVGLHYLAPSIYPPDPYLTPVPDPRLVHDASAVLAAGVDARADFIPTTAAPEGFPAEDGGYEGNGTVIRIGEELIQYRERSVRPPYGFAGCQRGFLGTRAAPHAAGARILHLQRSYGYLMFDMDTSLLDEVAQNLARVVNAVGVDMLYWDGSERLQGEHWYYNAKLHNAFYSRFKNKDMLLQGSSYSHFSWHIISRMASADGHGDLKYYLDQRAPGFESYRRNLMPLDIGWYYVYDPGTTPDQFEYVLGKSLGFDSSISLQTSPAHVRNHPFVGEIVDLVAAYERLRLGRRVPEATRARLRGPGKDYHLCVEGGWRVLRRVTYTPWQELGPTGGAGYSWEVEVPEGPCDVGVVVQVQAGRWAAPGPSYRAPGARLLESFDDLRPYLDDPENRFEVFVIGPGKAGATRQGVTQQFESVSDGAVEGRRCAVYTATNSLPEPEGWSAIGRRFDPPLDLSWHRGLGFWLRGDGRGGAFKLQLRDGQGATDYYVANNYTGWRYHQLARPERDPIDYRRVSHLIFYYNGLPGKTTVACAIDDVKALPALDRPSLQRPRVELSEGAVSWPTALEEGQSLTWWPGEPARAAGGGREERVPAQVSGRMRVAAGRHRVRFSSGDSPLPVVTARLVFLSGERLPLEAPARRR